MSEIRQDAIDRDEDWVPEPERLVSDVETLKAISDPLRLRIIETMARRLDPAWTVKELASTLDVPVTRLYHHVDLLLERDLVRPAGRRLVSGIVETRYRVAARSLRLDRALFRDDPGGAASAMHDVLATIFDGAREEIERGLAAGRIVVGDDVPAERKLLLLKGLSRLAPERAQELRDRLVAVLEEYTGDPAAQDGAGDPFAVVLAVYPTDPAGTADDTEKERPA